MKVFFTGGTGFVGGPATRKMLELGHEITILSRSGAGKLVAGVSYVAGDPTAPGAWQSSVDGHDAVINLAGYPIFHRWSHEVRQKIRESRILTTHNLVDAIGAASSKPGVLISASAVGYYGMHENDREFAEGDAPADDFLAAVTRDWEKEAERAGESGVRVARCRFGVILGNGGALHKMLPAFKKYLGAPLGNGRQWMSWIHIEDLARIFQFILEKETLSGAINCVSPEPVRNEDFSAELRRVLGRPTVAPPLPGFVLRLALGEFADVLLTGQKVAPKRLLEEGFRFHYPAVGGALENVLAG